MSTKRLNVPSTTLLKLHSYAFANRTQLHKKQPTKNSSASKNYENNPFCYQSNFTKVAIRATCAINSPAIHLINTTINSDLLIFISCRKLSISCFEVASLGGKFTTLNILTLRTVTIPEKMPVKLTPKYRLIPIPSSISIGLTHRIFEYLNGRF